MTRRVWTPLVVATLALVVGGCGQAQEAATNAVGKAASGVASQAQQSAASVVKRQICSRVQSGPVNARDQQFLSGLVSAAKSAGVPAQITTPLQQIARSGDQLPAKAVTALRSACR